MELAEKINEILKSKGMSKKFFAEQLTNLKPTLKSTGETPSISSIYGYLNGSREIKVELIASIAQVLQVSICELFDENRQARVKLLQKTLENPTDDEIKILSRYFKLEEDRFSDELKTDTNYSLYKYIFSLLPYTPSSFLNSLVETLENFKDLSTKAEKEMKDLAWELLNRSLK